MLYIAGNFIFLTGSRSKRDFYLTPLAPALALLIGSVWSCMWELVRDKVGLRATPRALSRLLAAGAVLALAGSAALPYSHRLLNFPGKELPRIPEALLFAGFTMMVTAAVKLLRHRWPFAPMALGGMAAVVLGFHFFQLTYTVPIRNAEEVSKQFYKFAAAFVGPSAPLAWYGRIENFALSFNAHRPITYVHDANEAREFMAGPGRRYILFNEKSFGDVETGKWRVVLKEHYSVEHPGREYILVCNR